MISIRTVSRRAAGRYRSDRPGWRRPRPVRLVTDVLLAAAVAGVVLSAVEVSQGRWEARPVLSGSMRPNLGIGSIALAEREPASTVKVGDVLVLHRPAPATGLYVHRVISVRHDGFGQLLVETKGDANRVADPGPLALRGTTIYRVTATVPFLGYPAVWLHSGAGRWTLVTLGGLLLLVMAWLLAGGEMPARAAGRRRAPVAEPVTVPAVIPDRAPTLVPAFAAVAAPDPAPATAPAEPPHPAPARRRLELVPVLPALAPTLARIAAGAPAVHPARTTNAHALADAMAGAA